MGRVRDLVGDETDHFVTRGLAKLLLDRGEFETIAPLAPIELRRRVFERAVEMGPLAPAAGPTGRNTAQDVLAVVATELKCTPDEIASALYADLKDHQEVVAAKIPTP